MRALSTAFVLFPLILACEERGHAPYGDQDLGDGNPIGGGRTTDEDFIGSCSDCFNVGPPSEPEESSDGIGGDDVPPVDDTVEQGDCAEDEVLSPAASACWRRCPVGQDWDGTRCTGEMLYTDWFEALAICTTLDSRYRAASRSDLLTLLGPCPTEVASGVSEGICTRCRMSSACLEMFGVDNSMYWTSSVGEGDFYDDPHPWVVSFLIGSCLISERPEDLFGVRCVRDRD